MSDALITTNNPIILRNTKSMPTIICEQRSVPKTKVTENRLKKANKNGFGEDIGTITNRITTMYDVLASLEKGSPEYDELMERIICGQAYQQESIDKIKGIEAKKMPKKWYDYRVNKILENDDEKTREEKTKDIMLMVNKKPYFFIYNYPMLMNKYRTFIKNINNNCIFKFGMEIEDLRVKKNKTEEEEMFLTSIKHKSPVFENPCTMNRICWEIEREFKDVKLKVKNNNMFDYNIYKTNKKYSKKIYDEIKLLFKEYKKQQKQYSETITSYVRKEEKVEKRNAFINNFRMKAEIICPNAEDLCNIIVDIVYSGSYKQFAWEICGEQIIKNLLCKNDNKYTYPILDENGDIKWKGYLFSLREVSAICEE